MSNPMYAPSRRLLSAAVISIFLLGSIPDADAQLARKRANRAEQAAEKGDQQPAEQAEAMFPAAQREEPEGKTTAKGAPKLQKLSEAYEKDDTAAAIAIADEVIADGDANAYERAFAARLAGAMLVNDDNPRALGYLRRALDFNGLSNNDHFQTMVIIAQIQLQVDQNQEGLATIETFLAESKSQDPEHLALKGTALYNLERYPEAIATFRSAIQQSSAPQPAWTQMLMSAYSETGQGGEANRLAEEIAAGTPGDKRAQLNLAASYMQMNQNDKAAAVLEKLRAAGELTDERDYRNLYALYLNSEGKEREAASAINDGLEKGILKPDYPTYNALAQAYYFSDQVAPAIDAYRKAAPLAPDGEAYLTLAKVLANEGRAAESKQAAQQAIDKGLRNPAEARKLLTR
ncbi:MAG: tetratricopeptide repeat protein [Luteimonas sp.]